jgi:hypothetical protein
VVEQVRKTVVAAASKGNLIEYSFIKVITGLWPALLTEPECGFPHPVRRLAFPHGTCSEDVMEKRFHAVGKAHPSGRAGQ